MLKNYILKRNSHTSSENDERATKTYQKKIRRGALSRLQPKCANCSHKIVFQHVLNMGKRAFTMIELIIVIAIVSILTTFGYESFTKARQQLSYSNAVERVISLIQKTRNYAITSRVHVYDTTDCTEDAECLAGDWDKVVPSGYGINIQPGASGGAAIIIFVDNRYLGTAGTFDSATDITLESYQVPNDVAVTINAATDITIIFEPPFADVKMYNNSASPSYDFTSSETDSNTAMISLESRLLPSNDTMYFNRLGSTPELQ